MALPYSQINAITEKKFIPKVADVIFDTDPLGARAKKKFYEKFDGGTSIMQPLNYAKTSAGGSFSGAQTLSTTDNDQLTAAEYQLKQYYVNMTISRRDELLNSGDAAMVNFVKTKVQIAEKTLQDLLADGLYSDGTSATDLVGLQSMVDNANTVGGLAQATYSWWQSQEDSTTTTLTLAALQTMHTALSINNDGPTVILATRANYNRFFALLQPQQRFTDSGTAKAGFDNLMFNGVPFIPGSKVPTSHIFFLNEKYLHLWVHKDEDMRFRPWQEPDNQAVRTAKIFWAGAFGTSNARMQGKLSAIAA